MERRSFQVIRRAVRASWPPAALCFAIVMAPHVALEASGTSRSNPAPQRSFALASRLGVFDQSFVIANIVVPDDPGEMSGRRVHFSGKGWLVVHAGQK